MTGKDVSEFLQLAAQRPLLDVRSPGEYEQGHIPGAISFPLFTDAERAEVGTAYKHQGKEPAFILGLGIAGPKMAEFVQKAVEIAPQRKVALHCWRGGQRSGSMAWLLRQAGFEVETLNGGYKNYRQHVLNSFSSFQQKFIVIGGKTGSGKTRILRKLAEYGEQIIDLEGLAHHKGSAFGFIGEAPQPTVEQFENDLFDSLSKQNPERTVWLENESRSIGRVFIPEGFWVAMKAAPLVNIDIPFEARIQNLLGDYVLSDKEALVTAFRKIEKKLGGLELKKALEFLEQHDFERAARIALHYYDKTYQFGLDTNLAPEIRQLSCETGDATRIAGQLMEMRFG